MILLCQLALVALEDPRVRWGHLAQQALEILMNPVDQMDQSDQLGH